MRFASDHSGSVGQCGSTMPLVITPKPAARPEPLMMAVLLLLFVLLAGPTLFLLQSLVQNTGQYLSEVKDMTFNLYAYDPNSWIGG